MEGDITKMPTGELEKRVMEMEDSYAELLGDNQDVHTLHLIWMHLKELRSELKRRKG